MMKLRHLAALLLVAACDGTGRGTTGVSSSNLPATTLKFIVQPSNVVVNTPIVPSIQVAVQTSTGVTVSSSNAQITLTLAQGTGTNGAAVTGTVTSGAVQGIATFNNLRVNTVGTGYKLTASAPALASATSASFDVTP